MTNALRLFKDTYLDSVVQLSGTRAMQSVEGVEWAAAAMATAANLETLFGEGFSEDQFSGAAPGDLFLAIRADSEDTVEKAEQAGRETMFSPRGGSSREFTEPDPLTLRDAVAHQPASNVAIISVPGDYAPLEAHKALTAGLNVLLFSDNVPVDAEVELKTWAVRLGRLMMGPGAGTAMLGGTCLGFANVVAPFDSEERTGGVAVVAAAGTGAQEAACLLDRWGVGVSCVIGLGGRDLTAVVGGLMAHTAVRALCAHEATDAILLVSKPPDGDVARSVVAESDKPVVASLIGLDSSLEAGRGVQQASTLETGVLATLRSMELPPPDPAAGLRAQVVVESQKIGAERTLVRGLFSGGTLCYESLVVLARFLGPVYSNTPIDESLALPAPESSHMCLDLGEEDYTQGRPHPMIDPQARIEMLRAASDEGDVAAIILDVVLGHGTHADPARELAPACAKVMVDGGPRVVVYVLGTEGDPQGFEAQRRAFAETGCVVTETGARASLAAAAIAGRDPDLVEAAI